MRSAQPPVAQKNQTCMHMSNTCFSPADDVNDDNAHGCPRACILMNAIHAISTHYLPALRGGNQGEIQRQSG
ncbi:hypothetical protein [Ensifer canadensis]